MPYQVALDAGRSANDYLLMNPLNPGRPLPPHKHDPGWNPVCPNETVWLPEDWDIESLRAKGWDAHPAEYDQPLTPEPPHLDVVPRAVGCGARHRVHPYKDAPERRGVERHVEVVVLPEAARAPEVYDPRRTQHLILTFTSAAPAFADVKAVGIEFQTAHAPIRDNSSDWTAAGSPFSKPEFRYGQPSAPVAHTKNQPVDIKLELEVWPLDADEVRCTIEGRATFAPMTFRKSGVPLRGGRNKIEMRSSGRLPDRVTELTGTIEWTVEPDESGWKLTADHSWGHHIFLTLGAPQTAAVPSVVEDGVTLKRLRKAVELVGDTHSDDPHQIVRRLMSLVPGYQLHEFNPQPPELSAVNHPKYHFDGVGGAWALADHLRASAQCQAIVRFVRALLRQVGCPGEALSLHVWGDPFRQGAAGEDPAPSSGLQLVYKFVEGRLWLAYLLDKPVTDQDIGRYFSTGSIGLNQFEACLRFTHGNVTRYYAGGTTTASGHVAEFATKDQVLTVFSALAWVEPVYDSNGDTAGCYLREIVKRYR